MSLAQQIITIALCGTATVLTRSLPFLFFSGKRKTPQVITYLGSVLPVALFAMLVVYCLKNVDFTGSLHAIPEAIALLTTVVLHLSFKKSLLSILGGTAVYVLLINFLFV